MIGRWIKQLFWTPFETGCRHFPLIPLKFSIAHCNELVIQVRIENVITRAISYLGGGYDYSVCYIIDNSLLIDTGYPWARRTLRQVLIRLGLTKKIKAVVNTHSHEDHIGNNDLLVELCGATIFAHPLAVTDIMHPPDIPWYRRFMFGPQTDVPAKPAPVEIKTTNCTFAVIETPGHSRDHICLFETGRNWLFSGDLYVAADLDSQLADADGPSWIKSLKTAIDLHPTCLFDGHGIVIEGADEVRELLTRKLEFLSSLRSAVEKAAEKTGSVAEITRRVFPRRGALDAITFSDGWLSLLTCSDFTRSNLIRSFLRAVPDRDSSDSRTAVQ